jgi:glycerol-3-phosphate dehydrogenase
MNIVLRRSLGIDRAVALSGKSGAGRQRELFLVPWRGVTMVGTHYEPLESVTALGKAPPRKVVESFVRDIAAVAPHARVSMDDVALVHWGALPLAAPADELPAKRPFLVNGVDATGAHGLVLLAAEKLTSAPWLSRTVVGRAIGEMPAAPATRMKMAPRAAEPEPAGVLSAPPAIAARLQSKYGSNWRSVLQHATGRPELLLSVAPTTQILALEVVHAIREEMALTLDDLVSRRLGLADAGLPGPDLLRAVAAVAAAEWGLPPQECERLVRDFPMKERQ